MSGNLADALQVWGLEENITIFIDGSFGTGFRLTPTDGSCWSIDQANEYSQRLAQFLNGLPSEIDFQFVQDIKSGNSELINKHGGSTKEESTVEENVVHELIKSRVEKFQTLDESGLLPKHGLHLFVRRKASSSLLGKSSPFNRAKTFETMTEENLKRELSLTERLATDVESGLTSLGLKPQRLKAEEVLNLPRFSGHIF